MSIVGTGLRNLCSPQKASQSVLRMQHGLVSSSRHPQLLQQLLQKLLPSLRQAAASLRAFWRCFLRWEGLDILLRLVWSMGNHQDLREGMIGRSKGI